MIEFIVFILLLIAVIAGYTYNLLSIDLSTFLVFILLMGLLVYSDRRKVRLEGIILIRRTQKGKNFIDRTAKRYPAFWRALGVLGIIIAIPTLFLGSIFLANQSISIIEGSKEGGVRLLLPGPVATPQNLPGIFVVPWWIWILGVATVIIPHEFMHGVMCRLDRIKIKSVGWILLLVIPGAFVEPDEKQLKKAKRSTKMKVYAAGSFANIIIALFVLVLLFVYSSSSFAAAGVFFRPTEGGPAAISGMSGSITEIDGIPVKKPSDIRNVMSRYGPGDTIEVKTIDGDLIAPSFRLEGTDFIAPKPSVVTNTTETKTHMITLSENPDTGTAYLGILVLYPAVSYTGNDFATYQTIITLLLWIYIFNLGIGIVNILPIKPLDGGLLFEEIVGHFTPSTKLIVRTVSGVMLLLLLINLIGPLFV